MFKYCHYTGKYIDSAHSICNLKYSIPKKIPVAFHDYYFVAEELANKFTCLREYTEKSESCSALITKYIGRNYKNTTYYN